jgi:hypothetical protein
MIVVAPAGARDVAGGQILTISSTRLTRAQGRSRYGAMISTPAGGDEGGVSGRYGQWLPRRMRDHFSVPLRSQKRASPADGGGADEALSQPRLYPGEFARRALAPSNA